MPGPPGIPGSRGETGPAGPPGGTPPLTFLEKLSWEPATPVSRREAFMLVQQLQLTWSGRIDVDRFTPVERASVHVFTAPARSEFPVRALDRKVAAERNVLVVSVDPQQQGVSELLEVGGMLFVDVVCDHLLDADGLPFSCSLGPLLTGRSDVLAPGGLMRVAVRVEG